MGISRAKHLLAGKDRSFARDEQLSLPCGHPGGGEALEELPLGGDLPATT
jgi:hypothetical protein